MHDQIARQEVPLPRPLPREVKPAGTPNWVWAVIAAVVAAPLILLAGLAVVGSAIFARSQSPATPVVSAPIVESVPSDAEVYTQTNEFIRELLVARKTAEFADSGTVTKLVDADGHAWRVESTFDSQNRYGAFLRGKYEAEIHFRSDEQRWTLELAYIDDELKYASKEVKQSLRKMQAAFAKDTRAAALYGVWAHDAAATRTANGTADDFALESQLAAWRKHRIEFRDDGFYVSHLKGNAGEPWIIWSLVKKDGNDFVLSLDVEQEQPMPLRVEHISRELIGIQWADGVVSVYRRQPSEANSGSNEAIPKS